MKLDVNKIQDKPLLYEVKTLDGSRIFNICLYSHQWCVEELFPPCNDFTWIGNTCSITTALKCIEQYILDTTKR